MTENRAHVAAYTVTYLFLFSTLAVVAPFYPLILQHKGLTPSRIGYVMGSYEMFSITGLMILGRLFDRWQSPRRTITLIGLACITFIFLATRTSSIPLVILLTLGLGFHIKSPTALMDALYGQTMNNPTRSYGWVRSFGSLGFIITSLTIHFTGAVRGNRPESVFLVYTLLIGTALISMKWLPVDQFHKSREEKHLSFLDTIRTFPSIFWIGLSIAFMNSVGQSGHYTFFSLLLKNKFNTPGVGVYWALGAVLEIPLFLYSGYLLKKLSLKRLWLIGLSAGIIRMQVYALSESLLPLFLIQVLHSFCFGINHLCMMTLITQTTSPSSRGLAMSIYTAIGMGFALFTGGVLGGFILNHSDFRLLFQTISLFPFMGACITLFFLKGHREITSG